MIFLSESACEEKKLLGFYFIVVNVDFTFSMVFNFFAKSGLIFFPGSRLKDSEASCGILERVRSVHLEVKICQAIHEFRKIKKR